MKIIFQIPKNHDSESRGVEIERPAMVRFSVNENDLIELRRYNFEACMQTVKSKKIKFSGLINDSKGRLLIIV